MSQGRSSKVPKRRQLNSFEGEQNVTMIAAAILAFCAATGFALPQITLPFNAQVPAVARVGEEYRFDLSPSTFRKSLGITYSIAQSHSWVQVNSVNGTLFGVPGAEDVGSSSFIISATDDTGSTPMPATLVVSSSPSPQIRSDAYKPLSKIGARCGTTCVLLPPSTGFAFGFPADSFEGTMANLTYYATNSDHTPLPAWIEFDPTSLVFSGTTPAASLPESVDILFIAAEVPGFASGQLEFTISVSQHQLIFVPVEVVNQSTGNTVDIGNLRGNLWLDGRPINDEDFAGATTVAPSWLQFDPSSIGFSGNPPATVSTQIISIWARDTFGDAAGMILQLNFGSGELYKGYIGVLNVSAGVYFSYQLLSTDFTEQSVSISVNFGSASNWLQFNRQNLSMAGMIPPATPSEMIAANLTVTSADGKDEGFQSFQIQIIGRANATTPVPADKTVESHRLAGLIAGSVVVAVFTVLLIICSLLCYNAWAKKPRNVERGPSTFKRLISKPLVFRGATTGYSAESGLDREDPFTTEGYSAENPPRVDLDMRYEGTEGGHFQVFQRIHGIESRSESQNSVDRTHQFGRTATPWIHRLAAKKSSKRRPISAPMEIIYPHSAKAGLFAPADTEDIARRPENRTASSLQARYQEFPEPESMPSEWSSQPRAVINTGSKWPADMAVNSDNHLIQAQEQRIRSADTSDHHFDLPARTSLFGFPAQRKHWGRMVRPVSRRSPYNATFFAGGSSMRRTSSAAGRRFAAFGLGLSTMDGWPDLESGIASEERHITAAGAEYDFTLEQYPHRYSVPRTYTNSSGRGWETVTSTESVSSNQPASRTQTQPEGSSARQPISRRRSQATDQRLWSGEEDIVSRGSSVYSGSLGEASALAESRLSSIAGGSRGEVSKAPEHIPIMERTRASYRLGATDKRTPLAYLRINEGARPWARRNPKAKGNAQRPVSVDGAEGGKGSVRGNLSGDEAFI